MSDDTQSKTEQSDRKPTENRHPAGPHAKPELTDKDKTPGTGSLPDETDAEGDVGPD